MYHLLERRMRSWTGLQRWVQETPVQQRLMAQAGETDVQRWTGQLVEGLSRSGPLRADASGVRLTA